jgi:ubiquitin-protein ligase
LYGTDGPVIRGRIFPEKDPYCFASFLIQIEISPNYPSKMPETFILDRIYHPNVREDGQPCCWRFNHEKWQPTTTLIEFIKAIIHTIDNPHLEHLQNVECANEYRSNYEKFYEKALQYTLKYGRPRH